VDVTAVDALKRQNNQKTKETHENQVNWKISNGNEQKSQKCVKGKGQKCPTNVTTSRIFFLTGPWHLCDIVISPESLLNFFFFFLPFCCCCCCARYEQISKTKFSRKWKEIFSRMGKRDKSRPPKCFYWKTPTFYFLLSSAMSFHAQQQQQHRLFTFFFSLSLSPDGRKKSSARTHNSRENYTVYFFM
jgi:hypothetical protein